MSLFVADGFSARARLLAARFNLQPCVSDFAEAEFASVVAKRCRTGELTVQQSRQAFANLDAWIARAAQRVSMISYDTGQATAWLRQLDLNLRAPDALHLAIAARVGTTVAMFDAGMLACARRLAIPVETL